MKTVNSSKIDRLGRLVSVIDKLTKEATKIKDELKDIAILPDGQHEFLGDRFRALVIEQDRNTVNYAKLIEDLKIAQDVVAKYTKVTAVISVKTNEL